MKRIKVLLVAVAIALIANDTKARPANYTTSVSVPQIGDSDARPMVPANLNELPCNVANIYDALANINTPATWAEIERDSSFHQVDESKSILHNFREGVLSETSTPEEVSRAMGRATLEYWLEKAGMMSKSEWQTLDPDMPNIKYVSSDGREAVYNKNTGLKVNQGINAGTANVARSALDPDHWYNNRGGDIGRFTRCKTPNELQRELAQFLVEHPELVPSVLTKETFLRLTDINQTKQCTPSQQPDLHSLDLDDPNGDWCKCETPGCRANMDAKNGYVQFGCAKCKKVNVKYAKMAIKLEQKMKAAGTTPTWYGPNAEANAHRAAGGK